MPRANIYPCTGIFHSFSTAVLHGHEVIGSVLSGSPESQAYYYCYLIHRVFTRALRAKAARYGPSDLWSVLDSFVTQQIGIISEFSPGLFWAEVIFLNVMLRDGVTGSAAVGYDRLRSWSNRFGVCGRWSPLELLDVITRITDLRIAADDQDRFCLSRVYVVTDIKRTTFFVLFLN